MIKALSSSIGPNSCAVQRSSASTSIASHGNTTLVVMRTEILLHGETHGKNLGTKKQFQWSNASHETFLNLFPHIKHWWTQVSLYVKSLPSKQTKT